VIEPRLNNCHILFYTRKLSWLAGSSPKLVRDGPFRKRDTRILLFGYPNFVMRMVSQGSYMCLHPAFNLRTLNIVHMVIHIQITSLGLQGHQAKLSAYFCAWIEVKIITISVG
jgi:hypothetical protein